MIDSPTATEGSVLVDECHRHDGIRFRLRGKQEDVAAIPDVVRASEGRGRKRPPLRIRSGRDDLEGAGPSDAQRAEIIREHDLLAGGNDDDDRMGIRAVAQGVSGRVRNSGTPNCTTRRVGEGGGVEPRSTAGSSWQRSSWGRTHTLSLRRPVSASFLARVVKRTCRYRVR
jgi:hypothetical protein